MAFWPDPENPLNCAKSGAAAQAVAPHRRLIPAPMVLSGTRYRCVCSGTAGSRRQNPSLSQDETHESSRILLAQWRVMTTLTTVLEGYVMNRLPHLALARLARPERVTLPG